MSFAADKIIGDGLTFDDVLLVPAYSEVLPREVEVRSRFTRHINLEHPIVSAAMDTVTESAMAIAMARVGGIGVIHKSMTVTMGPSQTVGDALRLMEKFHIGGIPVVDESKTLIGIVTNRDLRFQNDMQRPIREVMTSDDLVTISLDENLTDAEKILEKYKIEKLPVVDAHRKLQGLLTYRDLSKLRVNPLASKDKKGRLLVAAGVGVTDETLARAEALVEAEVDVIVIDTAHGHSRGVLEKLREVRRAFPNIDIVVGNIATADAAEMLVDAGADAVKVGIGPGSICTTRIIAGVGVPQVQAIYDVAQRLAGSGVPVVADGGIRYSGDFVKAIAAGADCIMAGSLLAGAEESPGETILYNGRRYKSYRGMGSLEAMQRGSKDRYFQDKEENVKKLVPEGIAARVPFVGSLEEVVFQMIGGLRAGMGYCGAKTIADLKKAKFIRITNAGMLESHPHDVTITSEAPNYSRQG